MYSTYLCLCYVIDNIHKMQVYSNSLELFFDIAIVISYVEVAFPLLNFNSTWYNGIPQEMTLFLMAYHSDNEDAIVKNSQILTIFLGTSEWETKIEW